MIRAIVTDIEGTTSSIAFVHEVLFPYAAARLPNYVREHAGDPGVAKQLDAVTDDVGLDNADLESIIAQLLDWIDKDVKATPLKALQGMLWAHGYESGDYRAHFYDDAVDALRRWHEQGIALYVYSSGSVRAQQLFFRYSTHGDLSGLISGWFDTTTGPKQAEASYRAIRRALSLPVEQVLFLSDVDGELEAARSAGMRVIRLARPDDAPLPSAGESDSLSWPVVESFEQIDLDR